MKKKKKFFCFFLFYRASLRNGNFFFKFWQKFQHPLLKYLRILFCTFWHINRPMFDKKNFFYFWVKFFLSNMGRFIHQNVQNKILRYFYNGCWNFCQNTPLWVLQNLDNFIMEHFKPLSIRYYCRKTFFLRNTKFSCDSDNKYISSFSSRGSFTFVFICY